MSSSISLVPEDEHQRKISTELARYRPRRTQRYLAVNVLLLSWRDDDIGCAKEVDNLARMFEEHFNYFVWPYKIPSEESQRLLVVHVSQFLSQFGGPDNLILVYYGGHGGPPVSEKSPCTWSALIRGGPTLDWSIIQPLFFGADCDVVIFLDCCYAGQAARARASHSIEFLAATDKDQWSPTGTKKWPSFTKVLIEEMVKTLNQDAVVTIPGLHSRMVESKIGLARQPFYVALSGDDSAGTIRLRRWEDITKMTDAEAPAASKRSLGETTTLYLRLSMFSALDASGREVLVKWMTKDSPSSIEDIQVVEKVLSEAKGVKDLGTKLIELDHSASGDLLPFLSDQGRQEAVRLFNALKDTLSMPSPWQLTETEAVYIVNNIKQKSVEFIAFVEDCLTSLGTSSLRNLSARDLFGTGDLRSRIGMRLTLLEDEVSPAKCRVDFDDRAQPKQRLRIGKQGDAAVLVEYWYYDYTDDEAFVKTSRQVAKISALHAEPKSPAFRSLPGIGFLHESLHGRRFGFIYQLPEEKIGQRPNLLSDLIKRVKNVPLEIRNRTANTLCEALLHLHSIGWLHKGIKSENVLIFSKIDELDSKDPSHEIYDLENPYLIGFDCSRPADAETYSTVDFTIKDNIYRHPERWGIPKRFERHHDLYALGILLIEIGCWRTIPSMDSKRANFEFIKDPKHLRDFLFNSTYTRLAHFTGTKFAEAVRVCLDSAKLNEYEDWQFQRIIREKVWNPLRAGC